MLRKILVLLLLCVPALAQPAPEQFDVRANYTKQEFRIPMRDGKHLFTAVYVPRDTSKQYPFLMTRTPYSVAPYGPDQYRRALGPSLDFDKAGYIFVFQDVRGRYMSEGEFVEMHPHIDRPQSKNDVDESTDTYDTIEYLLKNVPNNNGKVGIWGISYPGFYTSASIIDSHPAIKAASPEAPMTDLFMGDDSYHGGAFMLAANFEFYLFFSDFKSPATKQEPLVAPSDFPTNDAYALGETIEPLSNAEKIYIKGRNWLWDDQVKHDTYDDYWKARDLSRHMHGIKCAVLTVGGWFDAEDLAGPFRTYHSIEEKNPGITNTLVIGPWVHGGWARYQGASLGRVKFGSQTGDFWRKQMIFPFFEHYLKDAPDPRLPEAYVFETGSNEWRQYQSWPPPNTQTRMLYLHAGGKLSFEAPQSNEQQYDEYVSDPAHPVPYTAYTTELGVPQEYMLSDQRFATRRPDVLTYESEPLTEDVTVVGPASPKLRVSTSGSDSDFVVKLIDVFPMDLKENESSSQPRQRRVDVEVPQENMAGYEMLVRGEPFRGKFRQSFEKPQPFTPNQMTEVDFTMPDINHTFKRGHRIMVQVQSSWFPLVDLNPQTFIDIPNAQPGDFRKATERVYHSPSAASGIAVSVLAR